MIVPDFKSLTGAVSIVRILQVIFSCITFSLVASAGHKTESFWTWCMFTWGLCFCVTILIILFDFTDLKSKLPISWEDFTTTFAMLATLMLLASSFIYISLYTYLTCGKCIAATVISFLVFSLYATEVGLTRAKAGEISGFLTTVPGLLKVLEAFVACIIFMCLDYERTQLTLNHGLKWCIAVYSICFIFAVLIICLTIGRLLCLLPGLNKVLTGCNALAVLMYITALVIWPIYTLGNQPRPGNCPNELLCEWDNSVLITSMTGLNVVVYILDTFYSSRLVFVTSAQ